MGAEVVDAGAPAGGADLRQTGAMGFLDKAKQLTDKAQEQFNQQTSNMGANQGRKQVDTTLRNLGAWVYATRSGTDGGRGEAEIEALLAEVRRHEAEFGPIATPYPTPGTAPGGEAPAVTEPGQPPGSGPPPVPPPSPAPPPPMEERPPPGPPPGFGASPPGS